MNGRKEDACEKITDYGCAFVFIYRIIRYAKYIHKRKMNRAVWFQEDAQRSSETFLEKKTVNSSILLVSVKGPIFISYFLLFYFSSLVTYARHLFCHTYEV
jgi:hypothetical protein